MARIKKKWLEHSCIICSEHFFDYPSNNRKTCSRKCRTQSMANKTRGSHHYRWKGGISSIGREERIVFRVHFQKKVFERDNYTCLICGERGGKIQVDHIKRWADYPELRFNLDNCRTLCMSCHYYITFKRKMPEGTVWGHNLNKRIES